MNKSKKLDETKKVNPKSSEIREINNNELDDIAGGHVIGGWLMGYYVVDNKGRRVSKIYSTYKKAKKQDDK